VSGVTVQKKNLNFESCENSKSHIGYIQPTLHYAMGYIQIISVDAYRSLLLDTKALLKISQRTNPFQ
jgi:hypothetical protein